MEFGAYIKGLRKPRYSQKEFAFQLGVTPGYISKIEKGKLPPPSEEVIRKMAELLGQDEYRMIVATGKIPEVFRKVILEEDDIFELLKDRAAAYKRMER